MDSKLSLDELFWEAIMSCMAISIIGIDSDSEPEQNDEEMPD